MLSVVLVSTGVGLSGIDVLGVDVVEHAVKPTMLRHKRICHFKKRDCIIYSYLFV